MKVTTGIMSSNSDEWATPQDLFDILDSEFHFNLDPCADDTNHKCARYYTKETNGLSQKWGGGDRVFMNPPYGSQIKDWVRKARESAERNGTLVVALLPARTDTKWWQDVMRATEIRFIKGRVKFGESRNTAPFPSVIVVWGMPKNPVIKTMEIDRRLKDDPVEIRAQGIVKKGGGSVGGMWIDNY